MMKSGCAAERDFPFARQGVACQWATHKRLQRPGMGLQLRPRSSATPTMETENAQGDDYWRELAQRLWLRDQPAQIPKPENLKNEIWDPLDKSFSRSRDIATLESLQILERSTSFLPYSYSLLTYTQVSLADVLRRRFKLPCPTACGCRGYQAPSSLACLEPFY